MCEVLMITGPRQTQEPAAGPPDAAQDDLCRCGRPIGPDCDCARQIANLDAVDDILFGQPEQYFGILDSELDTPAPPG